MTNISASESPALQGQERPRSDGLSSCLVLLMNPQLLRMARALLGPGDRLVLLGEGVLAMAEAEETCSNVDLGGITAPPSRIGVVRDDAVLFGTPIPACLESLSMEDLVDWVGDCQSSVTWS